METTICVSVQIVCMSPSPRSQSTLSTGRPPAAAHMNVQFTIQGGPRPQGSPHLSLAEWCKGHLSLSTPVVLILAIVPFDYTDDRDSFLDTPSSFGCGDSMT